MYCTCSRREILPATNTETVVRHRAFSFGGNARHEAFRPEAFRVDKAGLVWKSQSISNGTTNKTNLAVFTSVHCMRVGVYRGSDRDEVTHPEQVLAHRLTSKCQTERGEVSAHFLDKGSEVVVFFPVHGVSEFVLEESGFKGLLLNIFP